MTLWTLGQGYRERSSLTGAEFLDTLLNSFVFPVPEFLEEWRARYTEVDSDLPGFLGWQACILEQIVDLREMAEQGQLADEQKYFGIDSPRGSRWYNFDPCSFLECGTAGYFGGWNPGDDSGRCFVPGPVGGLDIDGQIKTMNPEDVPNPVVPIVTITWEDFREFLFCGRIYE